MSEFDQRAEQLKESTARALEGLSQLSEEERSQDGETVARLERALAFVGLVMDSIDGELISEGAFQTLTEQLDQISANPAAAVPHALPWGDRLLDAVSRLPTARGQDFAQAAREAAANYQRSVQQRVNALEGDIETVQTHVDEVRTAADTTRDEIKADLDGMAAGFSAKLTEYEQTLASERSRIETTKTSHAETFREAQAQRDDNFQTALDEAKADLTKMLADADQEVAQRVSAIQRMEAESAALVGAIGLAGTAERYGEEVQQQRMAADFWRWWTVGLVVLAVAAIVVVVATLGDDPQWEAVVGKLAASVLFGGIATYAARQSARHRHREEQARALQLELTALGPFIEPLIDEQREEERVIMTRKTFGKASAGPAAGEEPGPTPLSFLLRRKEKDEKEAA